MKCAKCSAEIPDKSLFCNQCGSAQQAPKPAGPPEPEETLWAGRFSGKAHTHRWVFYGLYAGGLIALRVAFPSALSLGRWWILPAIILAPAPVIYLLTLWKKLTVRYRLTSYRFFRETGLLRRKISELELIRVDDVEVSQTFTDRLLGIGTITLITTDATDSRLVLEGIVHPVEVKEQIRSYVRKRRQGTINLESL